MEGNGNMTAGIGDPYWYEWSIGLLYIIDMLDSDSKIKSVILQDGSLQGLDDVVVNYYNGEKKCIQIKHTRENDSLTFRSMSSKSKDNGISYLAEFATDWKRIKDNGNDNCNAILFTNRKYGIRETKMDKALDGKQKRPPLKEFWPYIKEKINKASSLDEIEVEEKWKEAWKEWLEELKSIQGYELEFLKNFDIKASQEDLKDIKQKIIEKIKNIFKVGDGVAISQYQKLCFALIEWTTTLRQKQEIEIEDVYSALSLESDKEQGIHELKVPNPFVSSRKKFADNLEEKLKKREYPVIFLSGEPGAGKTSIVSYLTNKIDSVISLRFYSFKPLSPEDKHFTADKGVSSPKALWGDLLIQLRKKLKGKLSKYKVPVSIELIPSMDELIDEVLRLASVLSTEEGKITVIAIDGIDHAARAGNENTYLRTLIPPDKVPSNVCFLIAGQPINEYIEYPDWLSDSDEKFLKVDVPEMISEDISELYDKQEMLIERQYANIAKSLIMEKTKGNTLSVMYAVYEAKKCNNVNELQIELEKKKLESGLNSYYEYTWKSALQLVPSEYVLDNILAGSFTLINTKITGEMLAKIYKNDNIHSELWTRILRKLYPVVIEEKDGFRILHNDLRVYLEKYLRKNPNELRDVAKKIGDYYINESDDNISRHELIFKLLKVSNQESKYIDVFNYQYIMEAIALGRPKHEIYNQFDETINSLINISDINKIGIVSRAASTLCKFEESMQWADRNYEEIINIPSIIDSEKSVKERRLIEAKDLYYVLEDCMELIYCNRITRAEGIMDRWFKNYSPEEIISILMSNKKIKIEEEKFCKNEDVKGFLKLWGRVAQYTGINFQKILNSDNKKNHYSRALFYGGYLEEAKEINEIECYEETINNIEIYFIQDFEKFMQAIVENEQYNLLNWLVVEVLDKEININDRLEFKIIIWILIFNNQKQHRELIKDILKVKFNYLDLHKHNKTLEEYLIISIVLAYYNQDKNIIMSLAIENYEKSIENDCNKEISDFLEIGIYIGTVIRKNLINKHEFSEEDSLILKKYFNMLTVQCDSVKINEIEGVNSQRKLIKIILYLGTKLKGNFENTVYELIKEEASEYKYKLYSDIYWKYLQDKRDNTLLKNWFDYWMGKNGKAWNEEISEMFYIADFFIDLANSAGFDDRVKEAKNILRWKPIGYIDRKEYSLYYLLEWFKVIGKFNNSYWESKGMDLLNISEIANNRGDNRAYIQIESTVATMAGNLGIDALVKFANIKNTWDENWVQTIFDGIIGSMEKNQFTIEELKNIWRLGTSIFKIDINAHTYNYKNNIRKIYINDLKESILKVAIRLGYNDIGEDLKKISDYEFVCEKPINDYIIPERWFEATKNNNLDREFDGMSYEQAFNFVITNFNKYTTSTNFHNNFNWRYIKSLIDLFERDICKNRKDINILFEMLLERKEYYSWEYDGVNLAYEAIFKYLNYDQIHKVIEKIIDDYNNNDERDLKLRCVSCDLENLALFYYKTKSEKEIIDEYEEIINMHRAWITGNGVINLDVNEYNFENSQGINCNNWNEVCYNIINKFSDSRLCSTCEQAEKVLQEKKYFTKSLSNNQTSLLNKVLRIIRERLFNIKKGIKDKISYLLK